MRQFLPTYILSGIALLLLTLTAQSCRKQEPWYNRENIKGAWVEYAKDGVEIPFGQELIYIFTNNTSLQICGISQDTDGNARWTIFGDNSYYVYCCEMDVNASGLQGIMGHQAEFGYHQVFDFPEHKDSTVTLRSIGYELDGQPSDPGYKTLQMTKLSAFYDKPDSLIGKWEFDNENLKDVMLDFKAENKVDIYTKADGMWKLYTTDADQYHVYDDRLMLTTFDNEIFGKKGKWAVRIFRGMYASPYYGDMVMKSEDKEYHLTKVTIL